MSLLSASRSPLQLLSGMILLGLSVGCTPLAKVSEVQSSADQTEQELRSQRPSNKNYETAPIKNETESTPEYLDYSGEPEETKQCAAWQDFVAYEEKNPTFSAEVPLPQPPERFQDGCIKADDAPGGFNIYITENSFDNGTVMPTEPEADLALGFIPSGALRDNEDPTVLASEEPEWMHIGFSSSLGIETNEDFYEIISEDGKYNYAQYQRIFTNASPVPLEERVKMLEKVKAEWEASR